jgi:predicted acetyltransferase
LEVTRDGEGLVLRPLREGDEEEFLRAHRATTPGYPSFLHYYQEGMPFRRYLQVLAEQQRGVGVAPDHVPSLFLFAFLSGRIVGRVSIRPSLNERLERTGGHIGYVAVPEFRRRGCATTMLKMGLGILRDEFGLRRVLVTCDDDNVASMRTIEKCGGVLEDVVGGPDLVKPKRRYWIETDTGNGVSQPGPVFPPSAR